jgi:hypothetical protein
MAKGMIMQQVSSTLSFPGKHVVAIFGSLQEAEQATQALMGAGYHGEDMALIPSQKSEQSNHHPELEEGFPATV